jgi:hypothetical protein
MLPDNAEIRPGAMLGELHCNNGAILKLVNRGGNPFAACREDLKSLSNWIMQDAIGHQIKALYGSTILSKAASRLGFVVREQPVTLALRMEKFFFKGLLVLYNQEGLVRILRGRTADRYPANAWMSRSEFLRRYSNRNRTDRRTRRAVNPALTLRIGA